MKKLFIVFIILFAFYQYIFYIPKDLSTPIAHSPTSTIIPESSNSVSNTKPVKNLHENISIHQSTLENAFNNKLSKIQVNGSGKVVHILKDDLKGSRHQKFILKLSSGQTLLIAHNIDLASRINNLKRGDIVIFNGQYEWNPKGGVIHWTHHDPAGRHKPGWLKHHGRTYQ